MKFRTLYKHETESAFIDINDKPSLTQKADAKDANINIIVKKYVQTGMLPQLNLAPLTGDFSGGFDFRAANEALKAARDAFQAIPADIRKRFGNDPAAFADFAGNPDNIEELRKMNLAPPAPAPTNPPAPTEPPK